MDVAVRFDDVHRTFGGVRALDGLSFAVPAGSITALLGRNGAGKTTALRSLMGLIRIDRGEIVALGQVAGQLDVATKRRIGYVSERQTLDPRMTVAQLLRFARSFYPTWDHALERDLLVRLGIDHGQSIAALSLGGSRKLSLIVALAPHPDLLVLDEPAANLDVVVRREFLEIILDLFRARGVSVLYSTHVLSDVERIADRVALIDAGRLRLQANLDELKERVKALRIVPPNGHPVPPLDLPGVLREQRAGREVLVTVEGFSPALVERVRAATASQVEVRDLALEDIFLAYAQSEAASTSKPS